MEILNTKNSEQYKPSTIMLVYGQGGVGKTTFASTAPKPLLLDCENGAKYLGLRGISLDRVLIKSWNDFKDPDLIKLIQTSTDYETIIIDPIGEAMEKLIKTIETHPNTKYRQNDGSPTMAGWGFVKKSMRNFVKMLRDSGKNIIFVAHVEEKADEERIIKRPMIATKISEELINLVDIVGYMAVQQSGDDERRIIIVDSSNDKFIAKDRTGQLGKVIPPNFTDIIDAIQGNTEFSWAKSEVEKKPASKKTAKKETVKEESSEKEEKVASVKDKLSKM